MSWYESVSRGDDRSELALLLELASTGYGRHSEWFQKHRDNALRQLAVVLTAQLLVARFAIEPSIPRVLTAGLLMALAALAPLLAHAGSVSCRRAFRASLENAMSMNKLSWALSNPGGLEVSRDPQKVTDIPARDDPTPLVPRFIEDAIRFPTTEAYVAYHLGEGKPMFGMRRNTCFWAVTTIWSLGVLAVIVGVSASIATLWAAA